jgi:hypothetical protein
MLASENDLMACGGANEKPEVSAERRSPTKKEREQLRVELKLNMDKHYIIYNRITVCRGRQERETEE